MLIPGGSNTIAFATSESSNTDLTYNAIASDLGTTQSFVFNTVSNTITVVGSGGSSSTTTTISNGGGGGGGGGSSGGGPGGGGGGSSKPIINATGNSCYTISDVAKLNTFNVTFGDQTYNATENFISPNQTGVTVNGRNYTLSVGSTESIDGTQATIELVGVSYLPIEHTVTFEICSSGTVLAPQVSVTYIPLYVTLEQGQDVLSQLDLQNEGTYPEYLNISVNRSYSNLLSLSTTSMYLKPNQSATSELMFMSNATAPGTYTVPIIISLTTTGGYRSTLVRHIFLTIENKTIGKPFVSSVVAVNNYTNSASGIIQISSPKNITVQNVTLHTVMPASIATNISDIIAYGLNYNKTFVNNSYEIDWYLSQIPAGQSVYAYFTITKTPDIPGLSEIRESFSSFIPPASNHTNGQLKVINIGIPILYANTSNHIYAYVEYTGSKPQPSQVFTLNSRDSGATVFNERRVVRIDASLASSWNQELLYVIPGSTVKSTIILNLTSNNPRRERIIHVPIVSSSEALKHKQREPQCFLHGLRSFVEQNWEILAAIIIAGITAAIIGQIVRSLKGGEANADRIPENGKETRRTSKDTPEEPSAKERKGYRILQRRNP